MLKNIVKSNKNGKLLQNKRKRNENDQTSQKGRKKRVTNCKDSELNKNASMKEFTNISEKDSGSNILKERPKENFKESMNDDNISVIKSITDSNKMINISGINNFNDEVFDNIIKEFLNMNQYPTEPKEMISMLKKFISIYKKIKDDNVKLNNFLKKISNKLRESYEDIKVNIHFKI